MNKLLTMSHADKKTRLLYTVGFVGIALLTVVLMSTGFVFAANPITNLGSWILEGLGILIAALALVMGIVSIVKGQTVKGIVTLVAGAVLYALCANSALFGTIGSTLLGALGFGG